MNRRAFLLSVLLVVGGMSSRAVHADDIIPGLSAEHFAVLETTINRELTAFNAGDARMFFKEFLTNTVMHYDPVKYKGKFIDTPKAQTGDYKSRKLLAQKSQATPRSREIFLAYEVTMERGTFNMFVDFAPEGREDDFKTYCVRNLYFTTLTSNAPIQ